MKVINLSQIMLLGMLTVAIPTSYAFTAESLSDAISGSSSSSTATHNQQNKQAVKTNVAIKTEQTQAKGNAIPNPALFIEDAAMTAYIHTQLLLKRNIPSVNVTTENAVVSLNGIVDTQEQADTLIKIASSVKGVKSVNTDRLIVRQSNKING